MIAANEKYSGEIAYACLTENPKNGNPGIAFTLKCPAGEIEHIMWITESTIDRVKKTLTELGVKPEELQKRETLEDLNAILQGNRCKFTTKDGEKGVEVQWLNGAHGRKPASEASLNRASSLFGGSKASPARSADVGDFGLTDDDIPGGY